MRKENAIEIINPNEEKNLKVPKGMLIAGKNVYFSRDSYKTGLNNHSLVVGTSGSGKTRKIVIPNILLAEGSYLVSDPKGNLYKQLAPYLESKGYQVKKVTFIHPEKSLRFNPIEYCKTTQDIQRLAHTIVYALEGKKGKENNRDPFWDEAAIILFCSLIAYLMETDEIPAEEKTIYTLSKLAEELKRNPGERETQLEKRLRDHSMKYWCKTGKPSWAYKRFKEFNLAPDKTFCTILITSLAKLCSFDTEELRVMLSGNDMDYTELGRKKTAVFVEVSDTDRSMDALVNLFYTVIMNQLCTYADEECKDSRLPVPVQFILDDFATNAKIDNFENMISNIRSRNISAMIMVQSEAQLEEGYGKSAQTIIDNCNTYIFLGNNNPQTAKAIAERADVRPQTVMNMPVGTEWIFRRGMKPIFTECFDLEWFEKEKGFNKEKKTRKRRVREDQKEME